MPESQNFQNPTHYDRKVVDGIAAKSDNEPLSLDELEQMFIFGIRPTI